jgi:hypothetical protein
VLSAQGVDKLTGGTIFPLVASGLNARSVAPAPPPPNRPPAPTGAPDLHLHDRNGSSEISGVRR